MMKLSVWHVRLVVGFIASFFCCKQLYAGNVIWCNVLDKNYCTYSKLNLTVKYENGRAYPSGWGMKDSLWGLGSNTIRILGKEAGVYEGMMMCSVEDEPTNTSNPFKLIGLVNHSNVLSASEPGLHIKAALPAKKGETDISVAFVLKKNDNILIKPHYPAMRLVAYKIKGKFSVECPCNQLNSCMDLSTAEVLDTSKAWYSYDTSFYNTGFQPVTLTIKQYFEKPLKIELGIGEQWRMSDLLKVQGAALESVSWRTPKGVSGTVTAADLSSNGYQIDGATYKAARYEPSKNFEISNLTRKPLRIVVKPIDDFVRSFELPAHKKQKIAYMGSGLASVEWQSPDETIKEQARPEQLLEPSLIIKEKEGMTAGTFENFVDIKKFINTTGKIVTVTINAPSLDKPIVFDVGYPGSQNKVTVEEVIVLDQKSPQVKAEGVLKIKKAMYSDLHDSAKGKDVTTVVKSLLSNGVLTVPAGADYDKLFTTLPSNASKNLVIVVDIVFPLLDKQVVAYIMPTASVSWSIDGKQVGTINEADLHNNVFELHENNYASWTDILQPHDLVTPEGKFDYYSFYLKNLEAELAVAARNEQKKLEQERVAGKTSQAQETEKEILHIQQELLEISKKQEEARANMVTAQGVINLINAGSLIADEIARPEYWRWLR
jgi:hypothetical protein